MTPSRKRLERLERKLEKALDAGEEQEDPLRGLVELPPQDMGERSKPLEEVYERYQRRAQRGQPVNDEAEQQKAPNSSEGA